MDTPSSLSLDQAENVTMISCSRHQGDFTFQVSGTEKLNSDNATDLSSSDNDPGEDIKIALLYDTKTMLLV